MVNRTRSRAEPSAHALILVGLGLVSCARQDHLRVHVPLEEMAVARAIEPAFRPIETVPPNKPNEETLVPKTWLSREEVEAARDVEQQHAWDMQTFWAMRKGRESRRPTNIGPGGTCVCFGDDPLCSCR